MIDYIFFDETQHMTEQDWRRLIAHLHAKDELAAREVNELKRLYSL